MKLSQLITRLKRRLAGRPPARKTARPAVAAPPPAPAGLPGAEVCALWQALEFCLSRPDHEGGGLVAALELIRNFAGLSWAFLTVVIAGDSKHYYLAAAGKNSPAGLPDKFPLASGLAGWLHAKLKPLAIDRLKTDHPNSYIFQKNEPLRGFRSFYGWPVLYNYQPRGALILAGAEGETLAPGLRETLDCVADRLAAQLHLDRLIIKTLDMDRADSQTALPHRGPFLENFRRLLEVADIKGEELDLYVLAVSGLGSLAVSQGQAAASEILKALAGRLKDGLRSSWRLGHVSYGVFALAAPAGDSAEARALIAQFKKSLAAWPLAGGSGRADLGLLPALASYPHDGNGPEELLEAALTALAEGEEE